MHISDIIPADAAVWDGNGIVRYTAMISPETAEKILERNGRNRSIRQGALSDFAAGTPRQRAYKLEKHIYF